MKAEHELVVIAEKETKEEQVTDSNLLACRIPCKPVELREAKLLLPLYGIALG